MSGDARIRLAVLQDSTQFGGHELAFLNFLPALLESERIAHVDFSVFKGNTKFASRLNAIGSPKITLHASEFCGRRGDTYLGPFRIAYRRYVSSFCRRQRIDIALVVQGRIESQTPVLVELAKRIPLVSYIPMAHSVSISAEGRPLSRLGDRIRRFYYAKPDCFIVPSKSVAVQLQSAGSRSQIFLAENAVPVGKVLLKADARRRLNLAPDAKIALFVGRFDVFQKGLDRLLAAIKSDLEGLRAWTFLFVGDGAGRALVERMALAAAGQVSIQVQPWTSEPELYRSAADVLLLPSRYEGVPLAMLEAISEDLPILASPIDVFCEYLPAGNLGVIGGETRLSTQLDFVLSPRSIEDYRERCAAWRAQSNAQRSREEFLKAILRVDLKQFA